MSELGDLNSENEYGDSNVGFSHFGLRKPWSMRRTIRGSLTFGHEFDVMVIMTLHGQIRKFPHMQKNPQPDYLPRYKRFLQEYVQEEITGKLKPFQYDDINWLSGRIPFVFCFSSY